MIDDPRPTLARLAAEGGHSLSALSRMLGRNPAYLQQFIARGTPRRLAEDDRRRLSAFFGVAQTALGADGDAGEAPPLRVPRLALAASAGAGSLVDAEIVAGADLVAAAFARHLGLTEGQCATIRVRGDSMEPGLVDGDHILVDRGDTTPGRRAAIYVVRIDDAVMVKRVVRDARGVLVATSDNPLAPPLPHGPVEVIGRVVWQMRAPR